MRAYRFFLAGFGVVMVSLLATSLVASRRALDVPYEPTSLSIVNAMMHLAEVGADDVVYDLGCGDGRIVIAAAQRGARGIGVDLDPQRIAEARAQAVRAGVTERVQFIEQDLFQTDIQAATVVMLYLYPSVNVKLRPKLWRELAPGTRVVSHSHTMGDWAPDKTVEVDGHRLYYWVMPARPEVSAK